MKKIIFLLFMSGSLFGQIEERLSYLTDTEAVKYITPLATTMGIAFNSASYTDADIPSLFGFSFSIRVMGILIPDDDLTFIPEPSIGYNKAEPTATFYGSEGNYYAGPDGPQVYPPGINEKFIPMGYPQITASLLGTEVLLRYLPEISVEDQKIKMFGLGGRHSISQYLPMFPVDIAVQVLYNRFTIENILEVKNLAFNIHASKSYGLLVAYGGVQYENTNFDLTYTYRDRNPLFPNIYIEREFSVEADGDNKLRLTLGGALNLAFLQINADVNFAAQTAVTSGITLSF